MMRISDWTFRSLAVAACAAVVVAMTSAVPAGAAGRVKPPPLPAPVGLHAVAGVRSAVLSWTPVVAPAGQLVTGYTASSSVGTKKSKHCTALASASACTIEGLKNGTHYSVVVVAQDVNKKGTASVPVTVDPGTPDAPTDVSATIDTGRSSVSFVPGSDDAAPITSYTVSAVDATSAARGGQTTTGTSTPVVVTGLTDGDSYTFTVSATNAIGTGAPSVASLPVVPVPVPGTPTDVSAVPGPGQAVVDFSPPAGVAESFTVVATDSTAPSRGGQSGSAEASPIVVDGLTGGDSYTFTVTAHNGPIAGAPSTASPPVVPSTLTTLTAEGSSLASAALQQWAGQFGLLDPNAAVDWQDTSSVQGLDAFALDQVDIGATDVPYSSGVATASPDQPYQYIPDLGAGLGLMFNLIGQDGQRITTLDLTPNLIGRIFLGEITRWDDPAIVAANPQLTGDLPGTAVIPVYHSEAGGENEMLTDYLDHQDGADITAAETAFGSSLPGRPSATWPTPQVGADLVDYPGWSAGTPVGESGPDEAANFVASLAEDGSITYVGTAYATDHQLPVASVVNASGAPVQPTATDVSTALQAATPNGDLTENLAAVYSDLVANAYPLSTFSYLVTACAPGLAAGQGVSCDGPGTASPLPAAKGAVLGQLVDYLACAGQARLSLLGYAPLPPSAVQADFSAIGRIDGAVEPAAPTVANCADPTLGG